VGRAVPGLHGGWVPPLRQERRPPRSLHRGAVLLSRAVPALVTGEDMRELVEVDADQAAALAASWAEVPS
jgi:hypothetical protein